MRICIPLVAAGLVLAGISSRAWADEKSHRAAAQELLEVTNIDRTMTAAIDQMLEVQVKANPRLEPARGAMRKFLTKHLSYAALKDDLIQLYTAEFTEAELREIAAFYRTPTGKKAVAKLPAMMQKGAKLGVRRVQEHADELKQLIDEELRKTSGPG